MLVVSSFVEIFDHEIRAIKLALDRLPSLKSCPQGGRHAEYDPACEICDLHVDTPINIEERQALNVFLGRCRTHAVQTDLGDQSAGIPVTLDLGAVAKLYVDTLRLLDHNQTLTMHLDAVRKHVAIGALHEQTIARVKAIASDTDIPSRDGYTFIKDALEAHQTMVDKAVAEIETAKT